MAGSGMPNDQHEAFNHRLIPSCVDTMNREVRSMATWLAVSALAPQAFCLGYDNGRAFSPRLFGVETVIESVCPWSGKISSPESAFHNLIV